MRRGWSGKDVGHLVVGSEGKRITFSLTLYIVISSASLQLYITIPVSIGDSVVERIDIFGYGAV